jgi:hypothetical protein
MAIVMIIAMTKSTGQHIFRDLDLKSLLDQGLLLATLSDPTLMDEVHLMIEERNIRFLLTGSSVR